MKLFIAAASMTLALGVSSAEASCRTHRCWHAVHVNRIERVVEKRTAAVTPFGPCFGGRWAVPCSIIGRESRGGWRVLNAWTSGSACIRRACGPYQFLGWSVPWPVVVRSKYETLKRKLAHHREARRLWIQQRRGAACHWC